LPGILVASKNAYAGFAKVLKNMKNMHFTASSPTIQIAQHRPLSFMWRFIVINNSFGTRSSPIIYHSGVQQEVLRPLTRVYKVLAVVIAGMVSARADERP
jgi:hypothetical protein